MPAAATASSLAAAGLAAPWRIRCGQLRAPTAFGQCPGDPPAAAAARSPACIDGGGDCDTLADRQQLRAFAKVVDTNLQEALEMARRARGNFERQACDLRYAEMEDKGAELVHIYGPTGPYVKGGSYLYELRAWSDAVALLHRACMRDAGGCTSLIDYLRGHPADDLGTGGAHGAVGSKIYNELRLACQVGRTRSPVPNDSPVWCDATTGLCEQSSCRKWWHAVHPEKLNPKPWVDDRDEYDDLRDACGWVGEARPRPPELDELQRRLQADVQRLQTQYCSPKLVEGYCARKAPAARHADCVLQTGQHCLHGLVLPHTEEDVTAQWRERFEEKPVEVSSAAASLPLALQGGVGTCAMWPERSRRLKPRRRQFGELRSFL